MSIARQCRCRSEEKHLLQPSRLLRRSAPLTAVGVFVSGWCRRFASHCASRPALCSIVDRDPTPRPLALLNGIPLARGGEPDLLAVALGVLSEVAAARVDDVGAHPLGRTSAPRAWRRVVSGRRFVRRLVLVGSGGEAGQHPDGGQAARDANELEEEPCPERDLDPVLDRRYRLLLGGERLLDSARARMKWASPVRMRRALPLLFRLTVPEYQLAGWFYRLGIRGTVLRCRPQAQLASSRPSVDGLGTSAGRKASRRSNSGLPSTSRRSTSSASRLEGRT